MIRRLLLPLLKHYLFWLLLFAAGRTVFMAWNREELTGVPFGEILSTYLHALYLDTAMASYLLWFPFLFLALYGVTGKKVMITINNSIHLLLFIAFFLLTFSELPIYDEWHTKLNYKALWFFSNPSEVFHTASWNQLIGSTGATALFTWVTFWFYTKKIAPPASPPPDRNWALIAGCLFVPSLLFIGMRGGFQTIPIQLSDAYFSPHNVLNLAALNSPFNLASSCIENMKGGEPYRFLPVTDAQEKFQALHAEPSDSLTRILTTQRPNIVLVVLEGWSADMTAAFNGMPGITPHFDALAAEGIAFTRCYASGSLSDQGMAAVFSAFPAQPHTSVITQPNKYEHLPCINKELRAAGYHTSFLFGGQLSYGNIRSYMYFNEFDRILEGEDLDPSIPQGKLGVHDEFLFARQLQELKKEAQPFFAAMFTLSTHGPYDFPLVTDLNIGDKEEDYVNSVHYADSCIGDFISRARKEPWYDNTLFVFVSDHSHNTPKNYPFNAPEYRRIPMLFFGPVIDTTFRGYRYEATASQTDLAATLLSQLGLSATKFRYSKNLFNPTVARFAFYTFEEGLGYVNDEATLVWSVDGRGEYHPVQGPVSSSVSDSLSILKNGQAILQVLSDDYWQY